MNNQVRKENEPTNSQNESLNLILAVFSTVISVIGTAKLPDKYIGYGLLLVAALLLICFYLVFSKNSNLSTGVAFILLVISLIFCAFSYLYEGGKIELPIRPPQDTVGEDTVGSDTDEPITDSPFLDADDSVVPVETKQPNRGSGDGDGLGNDDTKTPAEPDTPEVICVRDVVGQPLQEAKRMLDKDGFVVTIQEKYSDYEAGIVLDQYPDGGSYEKEGTVIQLTVSKGKEKIKVPDVLGMSQSNAVAVLEDAGFYTKITEVYDTDSTRGKVIQQNPSGGSEEVRGSEIFLVLSKGSVAISSIEIRSLPYVTAYYAGDTLDISGLELALTYSDGSVEIVSDGFSYSPKVASGEGTQDVTVGYGGLTTQYAISVKMPSVSLNSSYLSTEMNCWDAHYNLDRRVPLWKIQLPSVSTTPRDMPVEWSIVSGAAYLNGNYIAAQQPGVMQLKATMTYNGNEYHAYYTVDLLLYKITTETNSLRSAPSKSADKLVSVPANVKVEITEVAWDHSVYEADQKYYLWGKVVYNGVTGWIVIS